MYNDVYGTGLGDPIHNSFICIHVCGAVSWRPSIWRLIVISDNLLDKNQHLSIFTLAFCQMLGHIPYRAIDSCGLSLD